MKGGNEVGFKPTSRKKLEQSNITQIIINTINSIFETLLSSIDNKLYGILDDMTFISSDILNDKYFSNIFGTSTTNGILLIANSLLLGILLYFAIKYFLSHITYTEVEKPNAFIFKLIIYGICMNFSYFILEQVLDINSYITLAIRDLGNQLFGKSICFSELISNINNSISIDGNSLNIFSLDGLLKTTMSISLLGLVFSYSLRYIMIKIFILIAPFAILSSASNSLSWFFKAWARNLFSLLFIQIIVALVLLILFSMEYDSANLFTKFVYIGGIYALLQANSFVRDFIGGVSTNVAHSVNNFVGFKK